MDQVIKSEVLWSPHEETLTHRTSQPTERLILDRNKELRDNESMGDLSFGRQLASIPIIAWEAAKRQGFDLDNPDGVVAGREIQRFLKTPYGRECLVRESKQKYHQGGF